MLLDSFEKMPLIAGRSSEMSVKLRGESLPSAVRGKFRTTKQTYRFVCCACLLLASLSLAV